MGLLSSELRAVHRAGGATTDYVAEFAFPGTTVRASMGGFSALGIGTFDTPIESMSSVTYGPVDRSGVPAALEMTIDIPDGSRTIARIKEGAGANEVEGSAATVWNVARHPTVNKSKWFTVIDGIVRRITLPRPMVARVTVRTDDRAFLREMLQIWRITKAMWPRAKSEEVGKAPPLIYGEHSAANYRISPGMIRLPCVDTIEHKYAAIAWLKSVDRVYAGDTQLAPAGFTITNPIVGGLRWTIVTLTSDPGDAEITIDAHGLETVGDGSGSMVSGKAEILAHLLTNFCFGQYKSGAYPATSSRIDSSLTTTIANFLNARVPDGALCIKDVRTPASVVAALCNEETLSSWWTNRGKLAFGLPGIHAPAIASETLDWSTDELGEFQEMEDDVDQTSAIQVETVLCSADGSSFSSFSVEDPVAPETAPDSLTMTTGAAK